MVNETILEKLNKKLKKQDKTNFAPIVTLIRELGCFSDITGREFEIYDKEGKKLYTILQKPMGIETLMFFLDELKIILEKEAKAMKSKGGKR